MNTLSALSFNQYLAHYGDTDPFKLNPITEKLASTTKYQNYEKINRVEKEEEEITEPQAINSDKVLNISKLAQSGPSLTTKTHCLNIDSRDRNRDLHAMTADFPVYFNTGGYNDEANIQQTYKNIVSIRLVACILPSAASDKRYVVLKIPELDDTMGGTNDILSGAFAILFPDKEFGVYLHCKIQDMCNCSKKFDPPLASFGNRLTLQFYSPDGELMDFGSDTTSDEDPDETVQTFATFEIKTKVPNKALLPGIHIV